MKKYGKTLVLGLATFAMVGCTALQTYNQVSFSEFKVEAEKAVGSQEAEDWGAKIKKINFKSVTKTDKKEETLSYQIIIDGEDILPGKNTTQAQADSAMVVIGLTHLSTFALHGEDTSDEGTKYYLGSLLTKGFKVAANDGEIRWNQYGFTTYYVTQYKSDLIYGTGKNTITISYK